MSISTPPTGYLRDILDQPKAVRDTLQGLRSSNLPDAITRSLSQGGFRRVVLTGMGASFYAFHPLHQALIWRGVEAHMVETTELLYALHGLLRADTLVIAASQSGRSVEIAALVEQKQQLERKALVDRRVTRFALLGITNTPDSPLATGADACVLTRAGTEDTVSCKTYLATLLALTWLEPALFGEPTSSVLKELEAVSPAVERYLSGWESHVADLKERLRGIRDVFVLGRGPSLAAAGTGGLIIKEATHMHGEGMNSAAFRHGPFEMASAETFALVFAGQGPALALNKRLYEDIHAAGCGAALVSENAVEGVFRLPAVSERARPVMEILPVQMLTLALADLHGHIAGQFTRGTKVTTVE